MCASASANGILLTGDYVIVDDVPQNGEVYAVDADGLPVDVKVTYWREQFMIRPIGEAKRPLHISIFKSVHDPIPCLV